MVNFGIYEDYYDLVGVFWYNLKYYVGLGLKWVNFFVIMDLFRVMMYSIIVIIIVLFIGLIVFGFKMFDGWCLDVDLYFDGDMVEVVGISCFEFVL